MAANNAAYISFTAVLAKIFDDNGVEYRHDDSTETGVVENQKWVDFQFELGDGTMHKLYVPKNKGQVRRCHTTILFDTDIEGVLELPSTDKRPEYRNGAIRSHLSGDDPERVARLIMAALKRGAPVPQKRTPRARTQQPQQRTQAGGNRGNQRDERDSRQAESVTVTAADVAALDLEDDAEVQEQRTGARH